MQFDRTFHNAKASRLGFRNHLWRRSSCATSLSKTNKAVERFFRHIQGLSDQPVGFTALSFDRRFQPICGACEARMRGGRTHYEDERFMQRRIRLSSVQAKGDAIPSGSVFADDLVFRENRRTRANRSVDLSARRNASTRHHLVKCRTRANRPRRQYLARTRGQSGAV